MTQVLRMEDDRGFGPFVSQPDDLADHVSWLKRIGDGVGPKNDEERATHPHHMLDIPRADLGGDTAGAIAMILGSSWRVGVKDKQQFIHWFPKSSLNWFTDQGFKVDIYNVNKSAIKYGAYQLMFDASKAKLVKSEAPTELLEKEAA